MLFFFQAEDGIRAQCVTGVQTCALPIYNGQISLSTGQGSALVVEGQSFALQAQSDPASGMTHIISNGNDITSQISGGQLGGTLQARDRAIPNLQTQLDTLASGIAAAGNTAHQAGT